MLIRVHGKERLESVRLRHRAKFRNICGTAGHGFGAQRIRITDTNERGTEHFGVLRDRAADGDSSRAGSLPCQVSRGSVFVLDQVLRSGDEIVNGVLLG